jgi:hypothetical protein
MPPPPSTGGAPFQRSALGLSSFRPPSRPPSAAASPNPDNQPLQSPVRSNENAATTIAHIEQVRMLVLGMEQRLQLREDKLIKTVERAEKEGKRFEELRNGLSGAGEVSV